MSHSKRAILLGIVAAFATLLWGCQAAGPIKVPLVTTVIPNDIVYMPPTLGGEETRFRLTTENPTATFTIGGAEYGMKVGEPTKTHPRGFVLARQLLITPLSSPPAKELTLETASLGLDSTPPLTPLELTFDNGQKYLLTAWGWCSGSSTTVYFSPGGIQTGKIGKMEFG